MDDLRALLRVAQGRNAQPRAVIIDSRTLQSTPESGERAGYDGGKRKKGSKVHIAVDTLGYLLGLVVTPASEQDRAQVQELARAGTANHWRDRGNCLCGPGVHGRTSSPRCGKRGYSIGSCEAARGQKGVCAVTGRDGWWSGVLHGLEDLDVWQGIMSGWENP